MPNLTDDQINLIKETIISNSNKLCDFYHEFPDDASFIFMAAFNESDSVISHSLSILGSRDIIFNCLKRSYDRSPAIKEFMQLIVKSDTV